MKQSKEIDRIKSRSGLKPFGCLLVAVVILLTGCGNFVAGGDIDVGVQAFRDYMPNVSQKVPLGGAAKVDNLAVTITSVRFSDGRGDGFTSRPAPDGYIYLVVGVGLENQGDRQELISTRMSFGLFDSLGRSQEWAFYPAAAGSVDGRIDPGLERTGELAWKVQENAEGFVLVFGDVAFSLGDASGYQPGPPD